MTDNNAQDHQLHERRVRYRAARLGYRLRKARTRVPESPLFGTYMLVDVYTNTVAVGLQNGYGFTLDEIEAVLNEEAAE